MRLSKHLPDTLQPRFLHTLLLFQQQFLKLPIFVIAGHNHRLILHFGEYFLNRFRAACRKLGGPEHRQLLYYNLVRSQIIKALLSPMPNLMNKNHTSPIIQALFLDFCFFLRHFLSFLTMAQSFGL